jgi:hypothetical protein
VRQRSVEDFHNLNVELARAKNHGHVELEDLYHERVRISYKLKE